jgi:tripartite-type tricarboxylate transporter receptor subunit TctC
VGVFVPQGTPVEIVSRLNAAFNAAIVDGGIRRNFADLAQEPVGGTAEQYAGMVHEDWQKYARLVKELHVKVE